MMELGVCETAVAGADLDGKLAAAKELGFCCFEPLFRKNDHELLNTGFGEALAARARKAGIAIRSAILTRTADLAKRIRDGGPLADELRILEGAAAAIRAAGGELLLLPVSSSEAHPADEAAWLDFLRAGAARIAGSGVRLGLECLAQSKFAAGHPPIERLAGKAGSPLVGIYYDVANAAACGEEPLSALRAVAARLFQIHVKDGKGGVPPLASFPLAAIRGYLRELGYQGRVMVETPPPAEPSSPPNIHLRRALQALQAAGF